MELTTVPIRCPDDANVIIGQAHFIKTVEDIHELLAGSVPGARFAIAFCEASGPCLIRYSGNDPELEELAIASAKAIAAGHCFVLLLRNCYPINILPRLKDIPEVCTVFCATANPLEVIVAEGTAGRGILGVIDGTSPKGVETAADKTERQQFLRRIGYKL